MVVLILDYHDKIKALKWWYMYVKMDYQLHAD